jgi:hypothetical protein
LADKRRPAGPPLKRLADLSEELVDPGGQPAEPIGILSRHFEIENPFRDEISGRQCQRWREKDITIDPLAQCFGPSLAGFRGQ